MKKSFNEFVQLKELAASPGVFGNTGMTPNAMPRFMRSLRQMLSARGVVNGSDDKKAARKILQVLRPPMQRLMAMGLSADDIAMAVQEVINLMAGQTAYTGFNQNRVKNAITNSPAMNPQQQQPPQDPNNRG